MLSYSLKCRKHTESKIPNIVKTKIRRIMLLSKCAVCNSKKLKFIKEQEATRLLCKLTGIKVSTLSDLSIANILFEKHKMNEIVNKLSLAGNKFI